MDAPPPIEKLVPFAVPSDRAWFDPRLILAATRFEVSTFILPLNTVTLLAVSDPMRVAIGFSGVSGALIGASFAPWADVDKFEFGNSHSTVGNWFTVREHLSLPTLAWYGFQSAGTKVRVTTITRV